MPKPNLLPRLSFFASAAFLLFLLGFAVAHFGWWPSAFLSAGLDTAVQLAANDSDPMQHMSPARHDLAGVRAYDAAGNIVPVQGDGGDPGVILLTSYWREHDWRPGIRLIDRAGRVLHDWDLDILKIWPQTPYTDSAAKRFWKADNYVHGTYLFDNGDVLLNIEYLGMARLDAGGNVVWRLDRRTHHSMHRADDGNFWVCESKLVDSVPEALQHWLGLLPPFAEDRAIEVSPAGEVLQEINILDVVFHSDFKSLLWWLGADTRTRTVDPLHLNDVEPLPAAMAAAYPMFAAGDLLVSLRNLNLVFVLDPRSRQVKWSLQQPLVRQHDPDFNPDGWISVFNNNHDGAPDGFFLGGSRLLAVHPGSGEVRCIYPAAGCTSQHERRFFSMIGGKAQRLGDDHWLITESTAGRVFEIDAKGNTVWEWGQVRHADGVMVSEVLEGTHYPITPDQVRQWKAR